MKNSRAKKGSVMLVAIFAIALLAALVMGIIQINIEEIQLMQNHINTAQALAIAEAGLNDAFAQIRSDDTWVAGFSSKPFAGGSYTVTVSGILPSRNIISEGISPQGFLCRVTADVTISSDSPYIVRVDNLGINE